MNIPENKLKMLNAVTNDLKLIKNIKAIVLGGSYCIDMANENSDLDIGIYYSESSPFEIEEVKILAKKYQIDDSLTVTGFYQWGNWVNGGAWINTSEGELDILYKNIQQIAATIEKCKEGIIENDYEQQPPYGFSSVIYLAETFYCVPLYDPEKIIENLKKEVNQYPVKLKEAIIQKSLWSAEFTLWQAEKFAKKNDHYNTTGCISRALKNIIDSLFAINELYTIGDKNSIRLLQSAKKRPDNLNEFIKRIVSINETTSLSFNVTELKSLFEETLKLGTGYYRPYFKL
ncbi:nucleotidyltransferase domain-containing protein [Leptospira kanakyensis]|uniref:nucleotidyltransferase domain-containing protein n=1 Tax=Leptospira kanakyensis TaxID=2484968 RepID=UPI00223D4412|nr:nucleotidyltransferase domain-containing protein [Leptospira kanakyensis]MCW7471734.1 nucleotidyltransferase domain-containing protein [Leptospira kanakyensis]